MLGVVEVQRQVEEARGQTRFEFTKLAAKGAVARVRGRHGRVLTEHAIAFLAAEARDAAHCLHAHVRGLAVLLAARAGGHVVTAVERCHHLGIAGHAAINAAADNTHMATRLDQRSKHAVDARRCSDVKLDHAVVVEATHVPARREATSLEHPQRLSNNKRIACSPGASMSPSAEIEIEPGGIVVRVGRWQVLGAHDAVQPVAARGEGLHLAFGVSVDADKYFWRRERGANINARQVDVGPTARRGVRDFRQVRARDFLDDGSRG